MTSDQMAGIDQEQRNGWLLLRLSGEIDLSNSQHLRERIEQATLGSRQVMIDLAEVEYIDSQGLRLLTSLAGVLALRGSTLRLVAPPGSFSRGVLDLTRVSDDIEVRDTTGVESASNRP
jgi:stage II sporulation protein AA (anti-sigma F factor antagonist)